jgi:hypothetical protein
VDWRYVSEEDKLINRLCYWWEHSHVNLAFNSNSTNRLVRQFGGTGLWSLGLMSHRIYGSGRDQSNLGRWAWTRYRGRNSTSVTIFMSYRPTPPQGDPFTDYAQQCQSLLQRNDLRCPRMAFLEDIKQAISKAQEEGDKVFLLLDGNENMNSGPLAETLSELGLAEAIIGRHGGNESTVLQNESNTPIDGVWCSVGLHISAGGYLPYEALVPHTNHIALWIDIDYEHILGHNLLPIVRPAMRRLQCQDPRSVKNFISGYKEFAIKGYKEFAIKNNLLARAKALEENACFPLTVEDQLAFEELDRLRCEGVERAEKKCRKLKAGQVAFSPSLKICMNQIKAWSLL